MLTVTAILDQYAWLYVEDPVPAGVWDRVFAVDGGYCATKEIDGVVYVMFRGSMTVLDWFDDVRSLVIPCWDKELGPVHPGARRGVLSVKEQLDSLIGDKPVVCVGHSLGAMHAAIYAAYRKVEGKVVQGLVMFGEPRPGGQKLSAILRFVPQMSFRNTDPDGHDIVTDVPRYIIFLFPYQHVGKLIDTICPPRRDDIWLAFRYHHLCLYGKGFGCGGEAMVKLYENYWGKHGSAILPRQKPGP